MRLGRLYFRLVNFHGASKNPIQDSRTFQGTSNTGGEGGGTPIYKPYRCVPPQKVSFSSISSLK